MSFEFVIAILVDQGDFTFTNVLFTKCRQCERWGLGKGKGVAPGAVPARHPESTLRKALLWNLGRPLMGNTSMIWPHVEFD